MNRNEEEMKSEKSEAHREEQGSPKISDPSTMLQQVAEKTLPPSPKKKRKSPAVPWKKPKDMPKRPLSSYNLFFAAERQKLIDKLSAGPDKGKPTEEVGKETGVEPAHAATMETSESADVAKKPMKTPGVGFANLAKLIASKWKNLDAAERLPFEEQASRDKARYDEAVAKWRVKKKSEQAQKKEKTNVAEIPKDVSTIETSTSFPALPPNLLEAASAYEADPYPAKWFDVSPVAGTMPTEGVDSMPEETSRLFDDSYPAYDSSQQSLDHGGPQAVRRFFPVEPPRTPPFSSLPGVPSSPETSLPQWSSREFQWNLQPRHSQMGEMFAAHEFARLPGNTSRQQSTPQSSQFQSVQPLGPPFFYPEPRGQRQPDPLSWDMERSWGQQGVPSSTLPQSRQGYSTSTLSTSPRGQYDPLPIDPPPTGPQYQPFQWSHTQTAYNSPESHHQSGGPQPASAPGRLVRSSMEPSRSLQAIASSLETMPQFFRPGLPFPSQQFDHQRALQSLIHNNSQSGSNQGGFNVPVSTAVVQDDPSAARTQPLPPQQGTTSGEVATSRVASLQRQLDDETIDFITGLPFP